ncbi:MAG: hypothetical protein NTW86_03790 [Candidatus Sumerlaeota bacterium]|nr:hypothetical protein [Candidatus Sumerlaeota bacterium]
MKRLNPPQALELETPVRVPVKSLLLDAGNPRLVEFGLGPKTSQKEILKALWEHMAVDEVAYSIAASGFWAHEHLLATEEGGKRIVIEGNRRLVAVKVLLDDELRRELRATDLPPLPPTFRSDLETNGLPVIFIKRREDLWQYLGFKHVNGPAKWDSYAKAQYVAYVRKTIGVPLSEIALQIGDRHRTVQRFYRALMVIEQAERNRVWKREYCYGGKLAFSHLMTALDYEGFMQFLHLRQKNEESPEPVNPKRIKELGEVCTWLWGDTRENTPPVIRSQNPDLRRLSAILAEPSGAALQALRRDRRLEEAYEISRGDTTVFRSALQDAKQALMKAQARVSTGYDGEKDVLEQARLIRDMALDLHEFMERKATPVRREQKLASAGGRK